MKIKIIIMGALIFLVAIVFLWYIGAQPSLVKINGETILLRTAQAQDFTVQHPYSWIREFVSIPQLEEDITVIPQGISKDKPYMVIYPVIEHKTIRIIFSVNDLSLSGLSLEEYSQIVEEFRNEISGFTLINEETQQGSRYYEYSYMDNNEEFIDIKKFTYKNGRLLSIIATFDSDLQDKYEGLVKEIVKTAKLRSFSYYSVKNR